MRITHGTIRPATEPLAVTIGKFDGVHLGHQAMLHALTEAAARLSVAACVLTFEPSPAEILAPESAPARLMPLHDKLAMFAAAGVDRVHVCHVNHAFLAMSAEQFVCGVLAEGLRARYVLVGDDFRFGAGREGNEVLLREAGRHLNFEVAVMPGVQIEGRRVSSSAVRSALQEGDLARAGRLLGRPYQLSGRVIHGDQVARQMGVPTANIRMQIQRPPLSGIFAVRVHGATDHAWPGVASLGRRPTLVHDGAWTLEAHLLDFDGDLYGRRLTVEFWHHLRDEVHYSDLDRLLAQIRKDVSDARRWHAEHG